jgi:hypothetical protein
LACAAFSYELMLTNSTAYPSTRWSYNSSGNRTRAIECSKRPRPQPRHRHRTAELCIVWPRLLVGAGSGIPAITIGNGTAPIAMEGGSNSGCATVASLPACTSSIANAIRAVTDAANPTYTLTGGGAPPHPGLPTARHGLRIEMRPPNATRALVAPSSLPLRRIPVATSRASASGAGARTDRRLGTDCSRD